MRKLLRLLVPGVAKSDCIRQPLDIRIVTGQKVPARRAIGAIVPGNISLFLGRGERGRFMRVEAHRHNFKLLAHIEGDLPERSQHAVHHLIAQHRTLVIDE